MTIQEAIYNKRNVSITEVAYGRYRVSCEIRGKEYHTYINNPEVSDGFQTDGHTTFRAWGSDTEDGRANVRFWAYKYVISCVTNANFPKY